MNKDLAFKLTNLVLAVLLLSCAIAAVVSLLQKFYFPGVLLIFVAGLLLLARRWSDYGRLALLLLLLFVYGVAYVTNVVFICTDKHGSTELEEARLQAARQLGRAYDARTPLQVTADLQARGLEAVPVVYPFELLGRNGLKTAGGRLLPLAGISGKTTVYCNECGDYTIYQADEHGFNNPPGLWSGPPADLLLVGDSFCHGACVPPGDDLGGLLRQAGHRVLNLGFGGDGPLLELGTLKEYAAAVRPKMVLWLYYEGNDLTDLNREEKCSFLTRYLETGFQTQDLLHRQGEIDLALTGQLAAVQGAAKEERQPWYRHRILLETLRSFQLKKLKLNLRVLWSHMEEYLFREHLHLLGRALAAAQGTVHSWGGTLYVVYLPSYHRYAGRAGTYPLNRRELVLATVRGLGIPLIDFHPTLKALPDPRAMFPFGKDGHYTAAGYRLLARQILAALPAMP